MLAMIILAVMVAVVFMVFLIFFIMFFLVVPGGSFTFNIYPAITFDVVRSARVDLDAYAGGGRQVTIDTDAYT